MVDFVSVDESEGAVNNSVVDYLRCWHALVLFYIYG